MELMEVSYAPEIAQSMLHVQQAQAKIDARALTIQGSVYVAATCLKRLEQLGHNLPQADKEDLS